ncbi:MAG: cytochrome c3 family protein [Smithellaceae bacterium]|nr:cytochrome c3 family protein [Smithellaceae bacterium]
MYKGYVVDRDLLKKDQHFILACPQCHQGNAGILKKDEAHKGLVKRPSDNMANCATCHKSVTDKYSKSLHYTTAGLRNGVMPRFSKEELKTFDEKVFEKSCRSCHASCGDCHVKSPAVGGISTGLLAKHKFVKKDEGKTCSSCHGGRVYPEYTGEYSGAPDVHYQKGMLCMDCHKKAEFHGDGKAYESKNQVKDRPACRSCHKPGSEKNPAAKMSHEMHADKVSCYGCHSGAEYRNCQQCHAGTGATAKPEMILGKNPRDKKTLTTLRLIPTVRDTFAKVGIKMENYDALPNYWDTPAHNIRKRTDRTRSCDTCHVERKNFLTKERLIKDGSRANEGLIMVPKPIKR